MTDALDRYYTPDTLALAICRWVRAELCERPIDVYEPCVGRGAFIRAARAVWPRIQTIGCDLDPEADGLDLCRVRYVAECAELARLDRVKRPGLTITNPPFSTGTDEQRERAFACVQAALVSGRHGCTVLLLPAEWIANGSTKYNWLREPEWRPQIVRPVSGRVWSGVRSMAVYAWPTGQRGGPTVIRESLTYERTRALPMERIEAPRQLTLLESV